MITIRIDKDKIQIPKYSELTVKQYRELLPFISEGGGLDYLRYISVTTGIDYKKALHHEVKGLERLNKLLGRFYFINYDLEEEKPNFIFKFGDKVYDFRNTKVNAFGYRVLLEQYFKENPTQLDCYLFILAAVIDGTFEYDDVIKVKDELQNYPAFHTLRLGAFFFNSWKRGANKDSLLLRMLKKVISINIRLSNKVLVLTD